MTDIAKTFRETQAHSVAVKEKERHLANRRATIEALKLQLAKEQEDYHKRRSALAATLMSITPLQAEVDAQWAQRNLYTSQQEARLAEITEEERTLAEKLMAINHTIVETVTAIDTAKMDSTMLPETDSRIDALERQLQSDANALSHLERLVSADDVVIGNRIEAFDEATGGKYPVDIVDAAMRAMLVSSSSSSSAAQHQQQQQQQNHNMFMVNANNNNNGGGFANEATRPFPSHSSSSSGSGRQRISLGSGGNSNRGSGNGVNQAANHQRVSMNNNNNSNKSFAPHTNHHTNSTMNIADIEQSMMLMADDDGNIEY